VSGTLVQARPTRGPRYPLTEGEAHRTRFERNPSAVYGVGRRPSRADLTPVDPDRLAAWQLAQDVARATYRDETPALEAENPSGLRGVSITGQALDLVLERRLTTSTDSVA
jgi:hypothetical protein